MPLTEHTLDSMVDKQHRHSDPAPHKTEFEFDVKKRRAVFPDNIAVSKGMVITATHCSPKIKADSDGLLDPTGPQCLVVNGLRFRIDRVEDAGATLNLTRF